MSLRESAARESAKRIPLSLSMIISLTKAMGLSCFLVVVGII